MSTKSVTIYHNSLEEEKTFQSINDLVKMIIDLNIENHTGSLIVEGISGDYVFNQMNTKTLLRYIESIDMWKPNVPEP